MEQNYYPIDFNAAGDSFVVTNSGTAPTPCVLTFIPKVDFVKFTVEGLSEQPISVAGIKTGDTLVIDGENRKGTINDVDSFDKYDAWEFPKLQPGQNTIKIVNGVQAAIVIDYNPRYI